MTNKKTLKVAGTKLIINMEPCIDEMLELGYKFRYCEDCKSVFFTCPNCGKSGCSDGFCEICEDINFQFNRTEFRHIHKDHFNHMFPYSIWKH